MKPDKMMRDRLDARAAILLTVLCLIWGVNAPAIKISNEGIAPLFCAGLRSVVATVCLIIWMLRKGLDLFPGRLADGLFVGFLFGLEFGLIYAALLYTTASSAWLLLYTTPFFHAIGAHFFLTGDRLSWNKLVGLALAFSAILILLSTHLGLPEKQQLIGDLLAIAAAVIWALTTVYIKRRLVTAVSPYHTLFYQILFSIPVLFLLSFIFRETPVQTINGLILVSFAYQSILVAFVSYLAWFFLVHTYPVSRLASFSFLTPVFATLAGVLLLGESLTYRLIVSLILVSIGILIVNRE